MKTKLDKLASFRINSERWEKFKEVAEARGKTATDLLNEYIDRVIGVGADAAPGLPSDNFSKLSIQDIDATTKKLIADSLEDGEIGEAIAKSYAAMMGNFNELLQQMEELKAAIPSPVTSSQSPDTSHQSPVTSPQLQITEEQKLEIIDLLGIDEILKGEIYYKQYLLKNGIDDRIKTNMKTLENLGITFNGNQRQPVARINFILGYLGYRTKNIGQRTIDCARGIECYQVQLP